MRVVSFSFSPASLVLTVFASSLARAGARLEEGWPPGVNVEEQYDAYLTLLYARFTPPAREDRLAGLRQLAANQDGSYLSRYARAVTASDAYLQTIETRRRAARGVWQAYFRTHDAFLMPTALVPAFPHDQSGNQLSRAIAASSPRTAGRGDRR